MFFSNIFSYFSFLLYIFIFILIFLYLKRIIARQGFNTLSLFILTFSLFYLLVPFTQTYFKNYRDTISPFTQILNQVNEPVIFINMLVCLIFLSLIIISYNLKLSSGKKLLLLEKIKHIPINKDNIYLKINHITNILFLLGGISIVLIIIEVGSLKTYLSLGSLTRGLDKSPTDYIRSSYLQLITLSQVILATPFLYIFLYKLKKSRIMLIKILVAFLFSVLFLLYNQGRAPLLLFFLPLLFIYNKKGNKGILGLSIVFVFSIFILNYLDGLFGYLAYGVYTVNTERQFITEFLGEFSYPFTNFLLRTDLVELSGYKLLYDYVIWPFTMVPSFLLDLIGFNKGAIVSISLINTESYGALLGVPPTGGIPVDFLTFNFYQFGYISLVVICFIIGRLLRKIDEVFYYFSSNLAIKVIILRISFSMINILNNADISAIFRNRLDVVVLVAVIFYIFKLEKKEKLKLV